MKVSITREGNLLFHAEKKGENVQLRRAFKRGHLHFSCKGLIHSKGKLSELLLVPSVITWQRPKRGI